MEVNVSQAAEILGVDKREVRRRLHEKELDGIKVDRAWVITLPDVSGPVATIEVEIPLTPLTEISVLEIGAKFLYKDTLYRKIAVVEGLIRAFGLVTTEEGMFENSTIRISLDPSTKVEKK